MSNCIGCHQPLDNYDGNGHLYKNGKGPYCKECYVGKVSVFDDLVESMQEFINNEKRNNNES